MKYLIILLLICSAVYAQKTEKIIYGSNSNNGEYASINGIIMYYEKYGEGEPVLLLHGGTGTLGGFWNLIPYLESDFQVYAVDLRGHGRTNNSIDSMSYDLHATDIKAFIDYQQFENLKVLGYSDGGVIALKLAIEIPHKIEKITVVGANKSVSDLKDYIVDFAKVMISEDNLNDTYIKKQATKYAELNPEPGKYKRFMQLMGQMWLRDPYITDNDYADIKVPTLLIYGDRDCFHYDCMVKMYSDLNCKKKQLCILPNANHFVFGRQYADVINPIIHRYLSEN